MTLWSKILVIFAALLACIGIYFLYLKFGTPLRPFGGEWSNAFTKQVKTKVIEVQFFDHINEWNAISDGYDSRAIVGSGGHWLGYNPFDLPNKKPARLWYDGRLIAEVKQIEGFVLSPNGSHYAYVDASLQRQTMLIDNKPFISGNTIKLYRLPDDPEQVYFSCTGCDSMADGFYRGRTLLVAYDPVVTEKTVDRLSAGECLFNQSVNTKTLVRKIALIDVNKRLTCSPNGNYILESEAVDRFPIGSKTVVSLNGRRIASGPLMHLAINDKGQPSYLRSDTRRGGFLVTHGKEYTFSGNTGSGDDRKEFLYSPSQAHIATVLSDENHKARWWVDGRSTDIFIVEDEYIDGRLTNRQPPSSVSLDDNYFYVYKTITP